MKFIIYAEIDVKPDTRQNLLSALGPLIEKIRVQTGCVKYDWSADSSDTQRINVYEEWTDEAALAAHFAGDNYKAMGLSIREHGILGAKARKFSINQEGPVFDDTGTASVKF